MSKFAPIVLWATLALVIFISFLPASKSVTRSEMVVYPDGSWFIPKNSGLGPSLNHVRAYVEYNGTVCMTMTSLPHNGEASSSDEIIGLYCVPKVVK